MHIRRVLVLAVAATTLATAPALFARQNNQQPNRRDQERRSQQEQRDTQALVQMVDAIAAGKQPAPTDIAVQWEANHFMRGADGTTYIPFSLTLDASKLAAPGVGVYVRVVSKGAAAAAAAPAADTQKGASAYPWDNVQFLDVKPDGKVSRAMALKAGEYEVLVAVKEKSPLETQRNQPPSKAGFLRRDLTVPDFVGSGLDDQFVAARRHRTALRALDTGATAGESLHLRHDAGRTVARRQVQEGRRVAGVVLGLRDAGERRQAGSPDRYNFHHKTAEGEKYFNKTAPQLLNASTLPAQFDVAAGHQLPGSLVVPLASFPVGDYRLEIKLTDKISGKTLTQNVNFTVEA